MIVMFVHGEEVQWYLDYTMTLALKFTPRAYDTGSDCMVGITPTEGWNRDTAWYQLPMKAHEMELVFS